MVLVGVRIDSRDHAASEIRHPSSHRPFGSGRQAGTGGHNSDEALAANRFLASHDRPGPAAHNGRKRAPARTDTSLQRHTTVSSETSQIPTSTRQKIFTVRKLVAAPWSCRAR